MPFCQHIVWLAGMRRECETGIVARRGGRRPGADHGSDGMQKGGNGRPPDIRPVRTVTVEPKEAGETVSLTGEIQPRHQADHGFRVRGKILQRPTMTGSSAPARRSSATAV